MTLLENSFIPIYFQYLPMRVSLNKFKFIKYVSMYVCMQKPINSYFVIKIPFLVTPPTLDRVREFLQRYINLYVCMYVNLFAYLCADDFALDFRFLNQRNLYNTTEWKFTQTS